MSRIASHKELGRKTRDDKIRVGVLLDECFDLLHGRHGHAKTKDPAKLLDAEKRVEQALAIDPNNPRGIEYEGRIFEARGNIAAARKLYEKSIEVDPQRPRPYNRLGLLSEPSEAMAHFNRAIKLDPKDTSIYNYNLARVLRGLGQLDEAESQLRRAIEQHPRYASAHTELGRLLKDRGRPADAKHHFELAIAADNGNVDAMTFLGALLTETKDTWDEGLEWLEHARKVDPTDSFPIRMMAAVYADNHQHDKAIGLAQTAMDIDANERITGTVTTEILKAMRQELATARGNDSNSSPSGVDVT